MENTQLRTCITSFTIPSFHEIPDIGLYLDQVSKYINSYLEAFPEMNVTPSMISNYAKQKLISRVNKKTYTRVQIAALILIVLLKNVISIENIRRLLVEMETKHQPIETVYEQFRVILLATCRDENIPDPADPDIEILYIIAVALNRKMILEKYFELHHA
ncbi:MAG: DUF1836 domain-containing protein [Bulleidia sp.]